MHLFVDGWFFLLFLLCFFGGFTVGITKRVFDTPNGSAPFSIRLRVLNGKSKNLTPAKNQLLKAALAFLAVIGTMIISAGVSLVTGNASALLGLGIIVSTLMGFVMFFRCGLSCGYFSPEFWYGDMRKTVISIKETWSVLSK